MLLALYVREPWSAHQKYRIFGDLETRIFDYDIAAQHIRLAQLIGQSTGRAVADLKYERVAKYGLTHFILTYLVGEIVRMKSDGCTLLRDPLPFLSTNSKRNARERKLLKSIADVARYVVTELNYFIREKGDEAYDYKTAFKSQADVHAIRNVVSKAFEKDMAIGRVKWFALPN